MNQDLQALEEKCTHLTLSRCKLEEEHQATLIKLDTETKAHENLIVSFFLDVLTKISDFENETQLLITNLGLENPSGVRLASCYRTYA